MIPTIRRRWNTCARSKAAAPRSEEPETPSPTGWNPLIPLVSKAERRAEDKENFQLQSRSIPVLLRLRSPCSLLLTHRDPFLPARGTPLRLARSAACASCTSQANSISPPLTTLGSARPKLQSLGC